jgi:hypothetical protein
VRKVLFPVLAVMSALLMSAPAQAATTATKAVSLTTSANPVVAGSTVTLTGTVSGFSPNAGVKVNVGGVVVTTDSDGDFSVTLVASQVITAQACTMGSGATCSPVVKIGVRHAISVSVSGTTSVTMSDNGISANVKKKGTATLTASSAGATTMVLQKASGNTWVQVNAVAGAKATWKIAAGTTAQSVNYRIVASGPYASTNKSVKLTTK